MALPNTKHQRNISVICDKDELREHGCNGAPDWIIEIFYHEGSAQMIIQNFQIFSLSLGENADEITGNRGGTMSCGRCFEKGAIWRCFGENAKSETLRKNFLRAVKYFVNQFSLKLFPINTSKFCNNFVIFA